VGVGVRDGKEVGDGIISIVGVGVGVGVGSEDGVGSNIGVGEGGGGVGEDEGSGVGVNVGVDSIINNPLMIMSSILLAPPGSTEL